MPILRYAPERVKFRWGGGGVGQCFRTQKTLLVCVWINLFYVTLDRTKCVSFVDSGIEFRVFEIFRHFMFDLEDVKYRRTWWTEDTKDPQLLQGLHRYRRAPGGQHRETHHYRRDRGTNLHSQEPAQTGRQWKPGHASWLRTCPLLT